MNMINQMVLKSNEDILIELAEREKAARRRAGITQAEMSARSGVSLGSLKRFERTGEISLTSLVKLSWVLNRTNEFDVLFAEKEHTYTSLEEALAEWKER